MKNELLTSMWNGKDLEDLEEINMSHH